MSSSADWPLAQTHAGATCSEIAKIIPIAIAVIVLGARALAADLAEPPPLLPPPPPAQHWNWSGGYLGIALSTRYNAIDANVTSATVGTPAVPIPLPTIPSSGQTVIPGAMAYLDNITLGPRIYGGWNSQVAPAYVVGVEVDFNYTLETSFLHGSPYPANLIFGNPSTPFGASSDDQFRVRTGWDGSARLRAGWLANPSTMIFFTAGVALAKFEVLSACSGTPTPNVSNCADGNYFSGTLGPATITHSAIKLGWTAGVGMDMLFASRWIARVNFRYSDFGYLGVGLSPLTFTDTRTCSGCPSAASSPLVVSYQVPITQLNFEVGLAYKFGQ